MQIARPQIRLISNTGDVLDEVVHTINGYWQLKPRQYYLLEVEVKEKETLDIATVVDGAHCSLVREKIVERVGGRGYLYQAILAIRYREFFTQTNKFILRIENKSTQQFQLLEVPFQIRTSRLVKFSSAGVMVFPFFVESLSDLLFIGTQRLHEFFLWFIVRFIILFVSFILVLYLYDWWNSRT